MLAIGVSAQDGKPGPGPKPNNDNTANLNQEGWMQWGFIYQYGTGNTATINQGILDDHHFPLTTNGAPQQKLSFRNVAFICQIGSGNEGEINQLGHGNYANLMQVRFDQHHPNFVADKDHHKQPYGEITQTGNHNIASASQFGNSYLNIKQGGMYNFVGGLRYVHNPGITGAPQHNYQQDNNTSVIYGPLEVGNDEILNVTQDGYGDAFYSIGVLRGGKTTIRQDVEEHHHLDGLNGQPHQAHPNFNVIYLSQKGGDVDLSQNGKYNLIWLYVKGKSNEKPDVDITQKGTGNVVAKYYSPFSPYASGPAEFKGESLKITQEGFANRLSIESESSNGVISVSQKGAFNFGMIYQSDFRHHH